MSAGRRVLYQNTADMLHLESTSAFAGSSWEKSFEISPFDACQ